VEAGGQGGGVVGIASIANIAKDRRKLGPQGFAARLAVDDYRTKNTKEGGR